MRRADCSANMFNFYVQRRQQRGNIKYLPEAGNIRYQDIYIFKCTIYVSISRETARNIRQSIIVFVKCTVNKYSLYAFYTVVKSTIKHNFPDYYTFYSYGKLFL
uniref:Uncharacterized protein n=1 Tax=Schizaphis graminum TaxID=13262 RepID=A0A2S2PKZ6_SCHGA